MRQELKDEFEGEELKRRLEQLTEEYKYYLRRIAEDVEFAMRAAAEYSGQFGLESVIENLFGIKASLGDNFSMDSVDSIISIVKDFIMRIGQIAREFLLEHLEQSASFSTDEDKRIAFINHVKNNTNVSFSPVKICVLDNKVQIPFICRLPTMGNASQYP